MYNLKPQVLYSLYYVFKYTKALAQQINTKQLFEMRSSNSTSSNKVCEWKNKWCFVTVGYNDKTTPEDTHRKQKKTSPDYD